MRKRFYIIWTTVIVFGLSACSDWFDLHPQSETILEDYWKNESDVKSMVGSCYRAMIEIGFMERLLVWGEIRSDNVIKGASDDVNIDRILNLTLNAANGYTSWNEFYTAINYCNTVIRNAPEAKAKDPNFTEGQLQAYLAEVKGIRALCYFTLVRTFRDIPFSTEPVFDDSKSFELPQSDPDEILRFLIDDLKKIENNAMIEFTERNYDKGRITRKAIWALIADMALWLNDYQTCIDYCDKVLTTYAIRLELQPSLTYYSNIFISGNSTESIFELQFNNALPNFAVAEMYGTMIGGRPGATIYKISAFDLINKTNLFTTTDLRAKDFFYPKEYNGLFFITKYLAYRSRTTSATVNLTDYAFMSACYHWIFYRLPDIYLMKAEALTEKGNPADLEAAFDLVLKTYDRANPDVGVGSLSFSTYGTQNAMRNLVFDERQREFLFEGKRYFDLLRRIKREGSTTNVVSTYLLRKYANLDQSTARSKINDKDALYMPINETELRNNTLLVQNPFYVLSSDISKK